MKRDGGEVVTRQVGPLSFRAALKPGSIDEEKRTAELVWTTGAQVLRSDWWSGGSYMEELSTKPKHVRMDRLKSGRAPLLDSHNGYGTGGVIGVVQSARLVNGEGTAVVRFAKAEDSPEADRVFRLVKDGILSSVSVGYRTYAQEVEEGEEGQLPVRRAVDWEPFEISIVAMPADAGAAVRSSDGVETNPCEIRTRQENTGMAKPKKNDPSNGTPSAAPAATVRADEPSVADEDEDSVPGEQPADAPVAVPGVQDAQDAERAAEVATLAERKRHADIKASARALATLGADVSDLAEQFIREGKPASAFRAAALKQAEKEKEPIVSDHRIQSVPGGDAREKWTRGAEASLIQRASLESLFQAAAKKRGEVVEVIDPGEFRGMSFLDLARSSLEASGVRTAGKTKIEIFAMALTQRGGGFMATGDFPVALENVMHKTLAAAYAVAPDVWRSVCAIGSVSDFRPHHRYRMGSLGVLPTKVQGAEYVQMTLDDATKESITALTKGGIIALTREMLIDDDMGVFNDIAQKAGRAAGLTLEAMFFALLADNSGLGPDMADGNPLFDATHSNIGTGAAISVASLDADAALMAAQKDPSNNEVLDLQPAVLLVPRSLKGTALVLNDAQFDPDTANKLQKPNIVRGLYRDVVATARLTGTRRYSFCDPQATPTIEAAFLDGNQQPYLETKDGWRTDGVEWKVRIDVAMGAVDFRGAVTNAGAP